MAVQEQQAEERRRGDTAEREQARSHAVEDYCKAIFALESRADAPVSTNALAERLQITPGSVSAMLKRLDADGLIVRVPYHGVQLTSAGRRVALEVIRHHRLLELFLAETLHMPWDRVHAEAEVLEHVISEELEGLIAAKLGEPTVDPHGDPIPTAALELPEPAEPQRSLDALEVGEEGVFVRVSDSDPAMLRYLSARGIAPGDRVRLIERQPFGGPLLVRFADEEHEQTIGVQLARAMRVAPRGEGGDGLADGDAPSPGEEHETRRRITDRPERAHA
jgi:DtxR family transcriptional regulator, Mn-dependent transcriptional regulator